MKTRLLIIIGLVLIFGVIVVTDVSQTQLEWSKVMREDLPNLENTPDQLGGIFANCNCQERVKANSDTAERCPQPFIDWENSTHYINNNSCEWKSISEKTVTGSYELENPLCIGGRGYIVNENCERIGKYDISTGLPIVENKEQCDMLDVDWNDQQNICDSKYGKENEEFYLTTDATDTTELGMISYGHQWVLTIILVVLILIAIPLGIILGVKVWRKRK